MMNERYELLMEEMEEIASKVNLFPESVRDRVFQILTDALTQTAQVVSVGNSDVDTNRKSDYPILNSDRRPTSEAEFIAVVKGHANNIDLQQ